MEDEEEKKDPEDEMDAAFELPMLLPKRNGPSCPMCDEPTVSVDGEYICFDCNGGMYGPGLA
jgi:hypothetical protein